MLRKIRWNYKEVDTGVAVTMAIMSDKESMAFEMECLEFMSSTAAKITEHSSLMHGIIHAMS